MTTTHVLITCANRMNQPIPACFELGQVPGDKQAERVRGWTSRLAEATAGAMFPAVCLYAGEHWSIARRLPGLNLPGEVVHLWSCSAGYGLIPVETPIVPHHATLTRGQADSVPGDYESWWSLIGEWDGPQSGQPRSIRSLVARDPTATYIAVLSKNYLRACQADIAAACANLGHPDRFFIVSAGGRPEGELTAYMIPADARLQSHFGGTLRALNARIASYLLGRGVRDRTTASDQLRRLLADQPSLPHYDRQRQSDQDILAAIAIRLGQPSTPSAYRMLRELRDAGIACEQHRFNRLYKAAKEKLY